MFLVGHAAVGISIVRALGVTNPVAAFGIGWASHYLADFFPHGDEPVGKWAERGNQVLRLFCVMTVDGLLFLTAFALFTLHHGWQWWAAAAALGSFVPDVLWGLTILLKRPLSAALEKFHYRNHNFLHPDLPAWFGMSAQLLAAALLWARLLS